MGKFGVLQAEIGVKCARSDALSVKSPKQTLRLVIVETNAERCLAEALSYPPTVIDDLKPSFTNGVPMHDFCYRPIDLDEKVLRADLRTIDESKLSSRVMLTAVFKHAGIRKLMRLR